MTFQRRIDLRYSGQSYELTVPLPADDRELRPEDLAAMLADFHREHDRAYGYSAPAEPVECVHLRLLAIGAIRKPEPARLERASGALSDALRATRPVYFGERGGFVDCPVYDRYTLWAGCAIDGPAIVEEVDSTTVIHSGSSARVDQFGNLILNVGGRHA
jgi:N-methylhydantoinase A